MNAIIDAIYDQLAQNGYDIHTDQDNHQSIHHKGLRYRLTHHGDNINIELSIRETTNEPEQSTIWHHLTSTNITNPNSIDALFSQINEQLHRIDTIVLNNQRQAGVTRSTRPCQTPSPPSSPNT